MYVECIGTYKNLQFEREGGTERIGMYNIMIWTRCLKTLGNGYGMYMERIGAYVNSQFEREGCTERIGMYHI